MSDVILKPFGIILIVAGAIFVVLTYDRFVPKQANQTGDISSAIRTEPAKEKRTDMQPSLAHLRSPIQLSTLPTEHTEAKPTREDLDRLLSQVVSRETAGEYLDAVLRRMEATTLRADNIREIQILKEEEVPADFLAALPQNPPGIVRTIGRVDGRLHIYDGPFARIDFPPAAIRAHLTDEDIHKFRVKLLALEFENSAAHAKKRRPE